MTILKNIWKLQVYVLVWPAVCLSEMITSIAQDVLI